MQQKVALTGHGTSGHPDVGSQPSELRETKFSEDAYL